MKLKRTAAIVTTGGSILFALAVYDLFGEQILPEFITVTAMIVGALGASIGPALFAFSSTPEKRRKIATAILIPSVALMLYGYATKTLHWPGAGIVSIVGVVMFTFTYGSLALKNKFEKWKVYTRSTRDAFFLSLFDFFGTAFLFLGILFKLMHWPLSSVLIYTGVGVLAVNVFLWNQKFKREVVYRKEAEDKLQESYRQIEEKQKEITDSITYAKRIQQSLLAHDEFLKKNLPEHFILYLPKDIVSGDFYWSTVTDDSVYLAVCDSTGHGVPGAFMSLLNISFLNEAINEKNIREPNRVFDYVRDKLVENLSQDGAKDGMDGIIVRINKNSGKLTYTAANNPPIIVNASEIQECVADKMPVGKGERTEPFTQHELILPHGAMLYLTTDGFADQFGGTKGKKFMRSKLREKLGELGNNSAEVQRKMLRKTFEDWKGSLEQVDDVLIVGIRF